jgi:rare lipoprotein A (peptidoglycan hydrolase)
LFLRSPRWRRVLPLTGAALFLAAVVFLPLAPPLRSGNGGVSPIAGALAREKGVQVGKASWYGGRFHGRKTASGEIFDQHALSAAHRSLKLDSIVRVTNLDNGRSVVLRVNDRLRRAGRVIDVSRAAAKRLGFVKKGIARVRVEVLREGGG